MKKLLGILVINLILCNTSIAANFGSGELKMQDWAVKYFIKYLRGKHTKAPSHFVIAKDSSYAMYSYCSAGAGNCRDAGVTRKITKMCEKKASSKCYTFARGRTVKWDNGINKGTKESKIYTKWSDSEIRAKLTELGFLGVTTSKKTKKKETKASNTSMSEELKKLNKLYEDGALTKEEFEKAKEKILN